MSTKWQPVGGYKFKAARIGVLKNALTVGKMKCPVKSTGHFLLKHCTHSDQS